MDSTAGIYQQHHTTSTSGLYPMSASADSGMSVPPAGAVPLGTPTSPHHGIDGISGGYPSSMGYPQSQGASSQQVPASAAESSSSSEPHGFSQMGLDTVARLPALLVVSALWTGGQRCSLRDSNFGHPTQLLAVFSTSQRFLVRAVERTAASFWGAAGIDAVYCSDLSVKCVLVW
ncbi:hypothetical protein GQ54DRAFT_303190 [Martensiomyces pterosporus]|nr:hypothetical protein GQ54DRAFT_303190 [Martensiomyces pterosporus]